MRTTPGEVVDGSSGRKPIGPGLPQGRVGGAAEVTGTAEISLKRNTGVGSDSFVGHVYTAPLPN